MKKDYCSLKLMYKANGFHTVLQLMLLFIDMNCARPTHTDEGVTGLCPK